jgi:hypothetical protein
LVILALSLQGDGKSEITPGRRATLPDELIRVGASIRELVNAGLGVALVAQSVADAPGPPVGVHQPQPADAHPRIALIRRIAWVVPGGQVDNEVEELGRRRRRRGARPRGPR